MITIEIRGFVSEEDAKEFISWYEGAGEQDSEFWQEEHSPEGNWYTGGGGLRFTLKKEE